MRVSCGSVSHDQHLSLVQAVYGDRKYTTENVAAGHFIAMNQFEETVLETALF